jgi:hypothetical protein
MGDVSVFWPGLVMGLIAGAMGGLVAGVALVEDTMVADCRAAMLESCKRAGGNQLAGFQCVRVEGVK